MKPWLIKIECGCTVQAVLFEFEAKFGLTWCPWICPVCGNHHGWEKFIPITEGDTMPNNKLHKALQEWEMDRAWLKIGLRG